MNEEKTRVLAMLKSRVFTPWQDVVDEIFEGDRERAGVILDELTRSNMIRCGPHNNLSLTVAGKMNSPRDKRRLWHRPGDRV